MADINVLMIGGRRAGKTSVLAAMSECCQTKLAGIDNLYVRCTEGSVDLTYKQQELEGYFTLPQYKKSMTFKPDLNPSKHSATYAYEVQVNNRDAGYSMCFEDIPGEWLMENAAPKDKAKVKELVNNSQVIIITIDTPHMVENIQRGTGVGKDHFEFNRVNEVTWFMKTAFQESREEREILFVPLKCEKYYYRNKMQKVNQAVKKGYEELLDFLTKSDVKELCRVAILPIITLGGAEFFKFHDNSYTGMYRYVENEDLRKYQPKHCEQPLFFSLLYLIRMSEKYVKQQGWITKWFRETFKNQARLDDLMAQKENLEKLIEIDEEMGFEIIQGMNTLVE